jgi:CMP/dCMP kinase
MIIAVDGPAAAGKGTLARALSVHYRLPFLDTGLLYRGVAWQAQQQHVTLSDSAALTALASRLTPDVLKHPSLRLPAISMAASQVSTYPSVRQALLAWQRAFAAQPEGAILDGRDIGTVVCPQAEVKFFVTARAEVRAQRRAQELQAAGQPCTLAAVLAATLERDARDEARATSPLCAASDAYLLDTSEKTPDDVFTEAVQYVSRTVPYLA